MKTTDLTPDQLATYIDADSLLRRLRFLQETGMADPKNPDHWEAKIVREMIFSLPSAYWP